MATDKIYATSAVSKVGSIGILAVALDNTKRLEDLGYKRIVVTSSRAPDKHIDLTTKDSQKIIKTRLDALERVFYSRVSEARGVSQDHIAEKFGKGDVLIASDPDPQKNDAIKAGMIDGLIENAASSSTSGYFANYPSHEGNNIPAQAGTKQEGQTMDLSELLKANPAAAAEVDRLKAEAKTAGREEAKAEYSAKVDKVLPIIQSEAYPANIKAIACNVLAGKEEMAAFTATITIFDAQKEAAASAAAQAETKENGSFSAQSPDMRAAAEKELDAAFASELEKRKVK